MKHIFLVIFLPILFSINLFSQKKVEEMVLKTQSGSIYGTLINPDTTKQVPLVLIIAGSGSTDRDGNSHRIFKNNSLKMLAEDLSKEGIATLRFDKRGIGASSKSMISESELRFEDYISDVKDWCDTLKKDSRFDKLIVLGHSEGSLIGMIASQTAEVDIFISIAGAGFKASEILRKQLKDQSPEVLEKSLPIIADLEKGKLVNDVPKILNSLFRPSVQPYMISWFKYNPQVEIGKINCPILIIQGTHDIQVKEEDANKLADANMKAKKVIIKKMNHVLKKSKQDRVENLNTYGNPELPLSKGLVKEIVRFIDEKK